MTHKSAAEQLVALKDINQQHSAQSYKIEFRRSYTNRRTQIGHRKINNERTRRRQLIKINKPNTVIQSSLSTNNNRVL